jgi:hypothetical protein
LIRILFSGPHEVPALEARNPSLPTRNDDIAGYESVSNSPENKKKGGLPNPGICPLRKNKGGIPIHALTGILLP